MNTLLSTLSKASPTELRTIRNDMLNKAAKRRVYITFSGRAGEGNYFATEEDCRNFLYDLNIEPEEYENYQAGYVLNGVLIADILHSGHCIFFPRQLKNLSKSDLPSWLLKLFPNMFRLASDDFYGADGKKDYDYLDCYGLCIDRNSDEYDEMEPLEDYGEGMYGDTILEYKEGRRWNII